MNKLAFIKGAAELVVSIGVGSIVGGAVKVFTPTNLGKFGKICAWVGGAALTNMVIDKAAEHTNDTIQTLADTVNEVVQSVKTEEVEQENKEELDS